MLDGLRLLLPNDEDEEEEEEQPVFFVNPLVLQSPNLSV